MKHKVKITDLNRLIRRMRTTTATQVRVDYRKIIEQQRPAVVKQCRSVWSDV